MVVGVLNVRTRTEGGARVLDMIKGERALKDSLKGERILVGAKMSASIL